jgi:hypothetical protein
LEPPWDDPTATEQFGAEAVNVKVAVEPGNVLPLAGDTSTGAAVGVGVGTGLGLSVTLGSGAPG